MTGLLQAEPVANPGDRRRLVEFGVAIGLAALVVAVTVLALLGGRESLHLETFGGSKPAEDVVRAFVLAGVVVTALAVVGLRAGLTMPVLFGVFGVAAVLVALPSGGTVAILVAAGICAWGWGVGTAVLRWLGIGREGLAGWEEAALGTGLGLGLLSHTLLALLLLGVVNDVVLAITGALGPVVAALLKPWRAFARRDEPVEGVDRRFRAIELAVVGLLCLCALFVLGYSLGPQLSPDAVKLHILMPQAFLRAGTFIERPEMHQSYFTLGLGVLMIPGYWLQGETAANLTNWAFLFLTGAVLWSAGDRLAGKPVGAVAAGIFAFAPLVMQSAYNDSSDLATTFFVVASLWFVAVPKQIRAGNLLVAGALAGLAVSFKLTAGYYVVPIAGFAVLRCLFALREREGLRPVLAFGLGSAAFGLPWLIVRWVQTGNPIFPILNNVFRSSLWAPVNEHFDLGKFGIGYGPVDLLTAVWQLSANPSLFGQREPPWTVGVGVALVVPAVIGIVLVMRSNPRLLLWAGASAVCIAVWVVFSQYHRYGLPAFVVAAVPAAWAACYALGHLLRPQIAQIALIGVVFCWFAASMANGPATFTQIPSNYPLTFLKGNESADELRRRALPTFDVVRYFDEQTRGTNEAGMLVGQAINGFAENTLYLPTGRPQLSLGSRIGQQVNPADARAEALIEAHIEWVVVDYTAGEGGWTRQRILAPEFADRHLQPQFGKNGKAVYRIVMQRSEAGPNLLCDSDFEAGGDPCWQLNRQAKLVKAQPASEYGTTALQSDARVSTAVQKVGVCPDLLYELSSVGRSPGAASRARYFVRWFDASGSVIRNDIQATDLVVGWRPVRMVLTSPDAAASAEIALSAQVDGSVFFDHVSFGLAEKPPMGAGC